MTISSTQNRAQFAGDDITSQFDFAFAFQKAADVRVIRRSPSGVETQLANLSDYSIANSGTGGRITLASALLTGHRLTILRAPDPLQETDLIENDTYSAEVIEDALDYGAMVSQRLADLLSRSLVLADSDTPGSGAYRAGGNRITALGDAISGTDAVTLAQVQALVASGGGGGGGSPSGWPSLPIPPSVQAAINAGVITSSEFTAVFTPINSEIGNLSASVLSLNSTIAGINTSVGTINTTITSMQAEIDLLEQISGDEGNLITLIETVEQQQIDGDAALATLISKMGAADGDSVSFLMNLNTVKVGPSETLGLRFSGLSASIAAAVASVATEQTARIAGDTVLAQQLTKIGALSGDGAAFIINLATAYVGPTESLAARFGGITSAINGANAAITTEAGTRAAADSSMATQITTMQSSVSGFNVAIQQNATAINGVNARYTVKIDNNGRVTGFGLISEPNNGTIVSSFVINADAFKVFNGSSDVAVFLASGGAVVMQNVTINGSLLVNGSVAAGKLSVSQLSAISADLGSITAGTIALASSGHIRAGQTAYHTGTGFWLGIDSGTPKFSIGNAAGYHMRWDGTDLYVNAKVTNALSASLTVSGAINSSGSNGQRSYGSKTISVSGGVSPYTYEWLIAYQRPEPDDGPGRMWLTGTLDSNTVGVAGTGTNEQVLGRVIGIVRDANGSSATVAFGVVATHGAPP